MQEALERLPRRPDCIVAPRHPDAELLATAAAEATNAYLIQANEAELLQLEPAAKEQLSQASTILIVDDVTITGTRLRGFKNYLRLGNFLDASTNVAFMPGICRPSWSTRLHAIRDMVGVDWFIPIETLLLPDWRHDLCPWCWELDALKQEMSFFPDSELMRARYESLRNTASGLTSDLFLHWSEGFATPDRGADYWKLGPGSIFGVSGEVELFIAVASAMQALRDQHRLNDVYQAAVARVLAPSFYLVGRYYDPIITASILRAAYRHDLSAAATDDELMRVVHDRLNDDASRELRSELILAAGRGRLPRSLWPVMMERLESDHPEPGVGAFLKSLLSSVVSH